MGPVEKSGVTAHVHMGKPVKILDLRDSPWVDGPGRTVLDTASAIDPKRCELVVGGFANAVGEENAYIVEARRRSLCVEEILETSAFDVRIVRQIVRLIEKHSIDVLHAHDFRSNLVGLYCAKRVGIPCVATCHGWIENDAKGKIYAAVDKFLLRFFDRVIVVSDVMRSQLVSSGVSSTKIDVVTNALVLANFTPSRDNQSLRVGLGIGPSTKIISNIGRLSPEKGQLAFISTAREVLDVHDDVAFLLIGIGEDEGQIRQSVEAKGLTKHVYFLGYQSDMAAVYDSTDLVVQSSSTEGMPNVVLEALLMETPVIATDVGGTSEVIEDGLTGRLVEASSIQQLSRGIVEFLRDPDRFHTMAMRGRQSVISKFDHSARVAKLTNIYEAIIGEAA